MSATNSTFPFLRPMSDCPSVSVIIPVFNGERVVRPLLSSLARLDYPGDRYEVILVDNGSTDSTMQIAGEFAVRVLSEASVRSSYAARNLGIAQARHEILAFTDADCVVDPRWVAEGVAAMAAQEADMVAGRIEFTFSRRASSGELYDSLVHMRNDLLVRTKGRAVTANLFIRSQLFSELGEFPGVQSGGDGLWTSRAVAAGRKLAYAPEAVVRHPARPLGEVLVKAARVGSGFRELMKDRSTGAKFAGIARSFVPPTPGSARRLVESRGERWMQSRLAGIWWVSYLYSVVWGVSALRSLLHAPGRTAEAHGS
jgi:glycosyltransferase involved in cell wall biosynthesis